MWFILIWLPCCHYCHSYSVGRRPPTTVFLPAYYRLLVYCVWCAHFASLYNIWLANGSHCGNGILFDKHWASCNHAVFTADVITTALCVFCYWQTLIVTYFYWLATIIQNRSAHDVRLIAHVRTVVLAGSCQFLFGNGYSHTSGFVSLQFTAAKSCWQLKGCVEELNNFAFCCFGKTR